MKETFLERRVGICRMLDIIMVAIIGTVVAITLILILTLTPLSSTAATEKTTPDASHDENCLDVAVIGAGIGGSYTAWRLRDKNLSISVFEYSDRVGGRLYSTPLPVAPGTYLEMGGMRFLPGAHKIFNQTVTELGLEVMDFVQGFGRANESIWYTRGRHMRIADLLSDNSPYNLDPREKNKHPAFILWDIFNNNVNFSSDKVPSVDEMYSLTTKDGIPLYKLSVDNFFGEHMSREAYKYLQDMSGFDMSVGKHSALLGFVFTAFPGNSERYVAPKTIKGGMQKVPQSLMQKFLEASNSHKLHMNHQLMRIEKRQTGGYQLGFRWTETTDGITTPIKTDEEVGVCARKVVLAAQKDCVEDIDFPVFKNNPETVRIIDSVFAHAAGKVFLAYNTPWWKSNNPTITRSTSDFPNLQSYDWSAGPNVSVILASYHDGENVRYWRELSQFGTPIPGSLPGVNAVTDVVKERMEKYLSVIFNYTQEDIPEAVGGGMMLWDTYPFQAAWHLYKPGMDERKVQAKVHKPSDSDDVYIVSNSWASGELSTWCEGTLEEAEKVINKYF